MADNFSFGAWLREELQRRGMTGKELARKAGVTARAVYHYLGGDRSPSVETASWLLEALGKRFEIVDREETK